MGNKDNSRMNLEKTAVVLKSILAGEYFGVEIWPGIMGKEKKIVKM